VNFILKMALRSAAAAGAKNIRRELNAAEKEREAAGIGLSSHIFSRRVSEIAGKAVGRIDPDKLVGMASGLAAWLEKESGGADA
jgi:fructose 1,6-bisphosphatase